MYDMINRFKNWYNYHKIRRQFKLGKIISSSVNLPEKSEDAYDFLRFECQDQATTYKLPLEYRFSIGYVNDDFIRNQQTLRIEMWYKENLIKHEVVR
jgi:hypothetical protein